MRLADLKKNVTTPVFYDYQVARLFPDEPKTQINMQLSRFVERNELVRLKRGIFILPETQIDIHVIASLLYTPSYVSLESALHLYGVIPDIVAHVTNVTTITSKTFQTTQGKFMYSKIKPELFFGFSKEKDTHSQMVYHLASAEKAFLDWIYIRQITDPYEHRVDVSIFENELLQKYSQKYPAWVQTLVYEQSSN